MTKLKLGALSDDKPVKLTVEKPGPPLSYLFHNHYLTPCHQRAG